MALKQVIDAVTVTGPREIPMGLLQNKISQEFQDWNQDETHHDSRNLIMREGRTEVLIDGSNDG